MSNEVTPQFEVTGHFFISGRGTLLVGQLFGGGDWLGMRIPTHDEPAWLTVSGVMFNCNPKAGIYSQSLVFREQPTLEFLQRVLPVGMLIYWMPNAGREKE